MLTTMTQKRQVTIAKALCDQVGLAPGRQVHVHATADGKIVIEAAPADAQDAEAIAKVRAALAKFVGIGADGESTDSFMARLRDPLP
jgi:antitoxin component of MazEF toxin-antitoxin module